MNAIIVPIKIEHIAAYNKAVASVVNEGKYLSFLTSPSLAMSEAFVLDNIKHNWPHVVAIVDDQIVGWCDITTVGRQICAHVGSLGIGVIREYRGKGIGSALIREALAWAQDKGLTRIELTVRENNTAAINLYKKLDFVIEGVHKNAIRIDGKYQNYVSMALLYE